MYVLRHTEMKKITYINIYYNKYELWGQLRFSISSLGNHTSILHNLSDSIPRVCQSKIGWVKVSGTAVTFINNVSFIEAEILHHFIVLTCPKGDLRS